MRGGSWNVKRLEGPPQFQRSKWRKCRGLSKLSQLMDHLCHPQGPGGVMKMLGEANEALGLVLFIKDDLNSCKGLVGRVPAVLHPSLYRAVKLTFPWNIRGLRSRRSHHKWDGHRFHESDRQRPNPNHVQSGHSTPIMFMMDLRLASLNGRGLRSDSRRSHLRLYLQRRSIDICPSRDILMVVPEVSPGW